MSLRLDSSLRVNFCLDGEDENLRVQGEELLDGELLHIGRGGEELVVGVLLLLQVEVRKLLEKLSFVLLAQPVEKLFRVPGGLGRLPGRLLGNSLARWLGSKLLPGVLVKLGLELLLLSLGKLLLCFL